MPPIPLHKIIICCISIGAKNSTLILVQYHSLLRKQSNHLDCLHFSPAWHNATACPPQVNSSRPQSQQLQILNDPNSSTSGNDPFCGASSEPKSNGRKCYPLLLQLPPHVSLCIIRKSLLVREHFETVSTNLLRPEQQPPKRQEQGEF